ncbi:hypothetical protein HFO65_15715 [Rhizobium laguerreae]|uniref:hypothetical protein n=1 Tax=Rhizobium laguerreae TaxID=1076926 RepID=UPI001C9041EF|nr:hypothetical protein [Rhizobium laguerreae]MBY3162081.1 hypothetical protein [Rhizobium laguerreae]
MTDTIEKLGRFGHHPDPAIDFCVEVEELEGMMFNRRVGFDAEPALDSRVEKAMDFRVGGDMNAIGARQTLKEIDAELRQIVVASLLEALKAMVRCAQKQGWQSAYLEELAAAEAAIAKATA